MFSQQRWPSGYRSTSGRSAAAGKSLASAAGMALLLAACGSNTITKARAVPTPPPPSGEVAKPATTIVADARQALLSARSVHVTGDFAASGTDAARQTLDLELARTTTAGASIALATGSVTTVTSLVIRDGGKSTTKRVTVKLDVIRVGSQLYIRGDRAYYARIGPKAAAVAGHWLSLPISADRSIAELTDITQLAAGLSGATSVSKLGLQKFSSKDVVVVRTSAGATLYVAATGAPEPLRLQRSTTDPGTLGGTLDFTDYGAAITVKAPAGAVPLARVRG